MREVRILFCLAGLLLLLFGCEGENEVTRSTLLTIKGKIFLNGLNPCCNLGNCDRYWNGCPDFDTSYCSVMNPYHGVKVSVFFKGNLVEKTYTDENGNFLIRVPAGIYDVKIYPPQDHIDTYIDVKVIIFKETDLGELYYTEQFVYQELIVGYYSNVTKQKLEKIIDETGNKIIEWREFIPSVRIEVPKEYHPQEMMEILETNYPQEIQYTQPNLFYCVD